MGPEENERAAALGGKKLVALDFYVPGDWAIPEYLFTKCFFSGSECRCHNVGSDESSDFGSVFQFAFFIRIGGKRMANRNHRTKTP